LEEIDLLLSLLYPELEAVEVEVVVVVDPVSDDDDDDDDGGGESPPPSSIRNPP